MFLYPSCGQSLTLFIIRQHYESWEYYRYLPTMQSCVAWFDACWLRLLSSCGKRHHHGCPTIRLACPPQPCIVVTRCRHEWFVLVVVMTKNAMRCWWPPCYVTRDWFVHCEQKPIFFTLYVILFPNSHNTLLPTPLYSPALHLRWFVLRHRTQEEFLLQSPNPWIVQYAIAGLSME